MTTSRIQENLEWQGSDFAGNNWGRFFMIDYFLLAIFALLIGSFLNVLIFRLPRKESILLPRSYCPRCLEKIKGQDLIPLLSYIRLQGKCRSCSGRISPQYPLVEVMTSVLLLLIYNKWGLSIHLIEGGIFTAILIVACFTDLNEGVIPDRLTYPGILSGFLLAWLSIGISDAILGSAVLGGVFFIIASLTHGGMGGGDVKLAAMIGSFTGLQGALMVFALSSILAGIWVLPLCLQGKAKRKTEIKFGPFLAVAAWLVWMYKAEIILAYWQLLS